MSYIKGKDLLLKVGDKAIGHCTSHEINYNTNSTEYKVKPPAEKSVEAALFTGRVPFDLDISISFEGLRYTGEKENGFEALSALWGAAEPVEVVAHHRSLDEKPYLKGKFVIDTLTEGAPADGDATYNGQLSLAETPEIYPGMPNATE